jgi:hypothetical protein
MSNNELTLTGATLTSDIGTNAKGGVEMTHQHGHHQHQHQHSHSHSHSHGSHAAADAKSLGGDCCGRPMAPPRPAPPKPMTTQELLESPPKQIFALVCALVRLGQFSAFEPMVKALLEKRKDDRILDMLGEDGHSLLHWAAKRREYLDLLLTTVDYFM